MPRLPGCPGRFQEAGLPLHRDVLRLEIVEHAVVTALAADSALLRATEGRRRIADQATVQADHAKLQRFADPKAACQISGVDVADQSMLGRVRVPERLRL